jgi:hypothetical protein
MNVLKLLKNVRLQMWFDHESESFNAESVWNASKGNINFNTELQNSIVFRLTLLRCVEFFKKHLKRVLLHAYII